MLQNDSISSLALIILVFNELGDLIKQSDYLSHYFCFHAALTILYLPHYIV